MCMFSFYSILCLLSVTFTDEVRTMDVTSVSGLDTDPPEKQDTFFYYTLMLATTSSSRASSVVRLPISRRVLGRVT